MNVERWLSAATSHAETIRVSRNGLTPLLTTLGILTPLSFALAVFADKTWLQVALFGCGLLTLLVVIVAYFLLILHRPELLQTEEYRLRKEALTAFKRGASPEILKAAAELARLEDRSRVAGRKELER